MTARAFLLGPIVVLGLACTVFQGPPDVGDRAPDFSIPDTAWVNHSLTEWRGKVVLLNFWLEG